MSVLCSVISLKTLSLKELQPQQSEVHFQVTWQQHSHLLGGTRLSEPHKHTDACLNGVHIPENKQASVLDWKLLIILTLRAGFV